MLAPERLEALYQRAKRTRALWETLFDDCFQYTMPNRERFHSNTKGQRGDELIFDETAVHGLQEFASRLQHGLVPNFSRWAELAAGPEIEPSQRASVNGSLDEVTEYLFEVISDSNFSTEVHEAFLDLGVGTGCLAVYPGTADKPLIFKAIPITRLLLDEGPDGRIGRMYYQRPIRPDELKQAYPGVTLTEELQKKIEECAKRSEGEIEIIECVVRNYDEPEVEKWEQYIYWPEEKAILRDAKFEGVGSCPFIPFRWSVAAHETWGRGPVVSALSAIKTTNLVIQMILENASMSIAGIWQTDDEDVVNADTISLTPGTIIPVGMGTRGLEPLQSPGNFNVADIILSDQRLNIRKALFNDMLGDPDKTPATATEVAERQADLARRMGAAFGRLQSELVGPIVQRAVYILREQGRISVPTVSGTRITIKSVSPLSQAQANEDINAFARFVEHAALAHGPEMAMMALNPEESIPWLQQKFNVPEKLIRTADEIAAALQQAAGAAQQFQEGGAVDPAQIQGGG